MGARCDDDHALEEIREEGDDLVRLKLTPTSTAAAQLKSVHVLWRTGCSSVTGTWARLIS